MPFLEDGTCEVYIIRFYANINIFTPHCLPWLVRQASASEAGIHTLMEQQPAGEKTYS